MYARLSVLLAALITLSGFITMATASPIGETQDAFLDLDGDWTLTSVTCADGTKGFKNYDSTLVQIKGFEINADLTQDGCEIFLEGVAKIEGKILTTEFGSGSWTRCSGSMPTYVLNRFEVSMMKGKSEDTMTLTGMDLSPFGTCPARSGSLHFKSE